jgi:hypothetical protein
MIEDYSMFIVGHILVSHLRILGAKTPCHGP